MALRTSLRPPGTGPSCRLASATPLLHGAPGQEDTEAGARRQARLQAISGSHSPSLPPRGLPQFCPLWVWPPSTRHGHLQYCHPSLGSTVSRALELPLPPLGWGEESTREGQPHTALGGLSRPSPDPAWLLGCWGEARLPETHPQIPASHLLTSVDRRQSLFLCSPTAKITSSQSNWVRGGQTERVQEVSQVTPTQQWP